MSRKTKQYYRWTTGQISKLRKLYSVVSREELIVALSPHPLDSILHMARRQGLTKPRQRDWVKIVAAYKPIVFSHRVSEASQGPQGA